jgi:hypothetical protein
VFGGKAHRIYIRSEDNTHLEKIDDFGLKKSERRTDAYWKDDGSIWEIKSGYKKGAIDDEQLDDYFLMQQAGFVNVEQDGKKKKLPVTSVNYIFDSVEGAKKNWDARATFWYLNEKKELLLFEPDK